MKHALSIQVKKSARGRRACCSLFSSSLFALRCSSIANRERRVAISSSTSVEGKAGHANRDRNSSRYDGTVKTLNELYSSLSARRRYEVWFVRLGLADGGGAWWFRYLLMNPARAVAPATRAGFPSRCGPHGFRRAENRKASFKDFLWRNWILAPEGKIHSTSEPATVPSAKAPAGEHWKSKDTRFHGICNIVRRF